MVNADIAGLNVLQARNQGPRLRDRDYKGSCSLGGGDIRATTLKRFRC